MLKEVMNDSSTVRKVEESVYREEKKKKVCRTAFSTPGGGCMVVEFEEDE